jgi:Na+(H+)/acetate symporter ActP
MQEANYQSLFRTILWIVAVYFVLKFLARLFLPIMMQKMVEKAQEQFKQQHQNQFDTTANQDSTASDKPKEKKIVGDYIDYEEVD